MIHIYYGDGKGKTTAACGLALRAAGSGMRVLFTQFFKSGKSSEIDSLEHLPTVTVRLPSLWHGRFKNMSDQQKKEIGACYSDLLESIISSAQDYDMIVLDEGVHAYRYELIDRQQLLSFLKAEGSAREIVLTGRNPASELLDLADYATEMRKKKHPFDRGVFGRKGIEF